MCGGNVAPSLARGSDQQQAPERPKRQAKKRRGTSHVDLDVHLATVRPRQRMNVRHYGAVCVGAAILLGVYADGGKKPCKRMNLLRNNATNTLTPEPHSVPNPILGLIFPAMVKKGVSAAEKKQRLLNWFYDSKQGGSPQARCMSMDLVCRTQLESHAQSSRRRAGHGSPPNPPPHTRTHTPW